MEKPKIEHIYVINLDRQKDRMAKMEQELRHVLDYYGGELWNLTERYSAVDAKQFLKNPQKDEIVDPIYSLREQLFVEPQPLTLPTKIELDSPIQMSWQEIAIALSHIDVWGKMKSSKYEYALILEDDVWLSTGFVQNLDLAWSDIKNQSNNKSNFDILYLSYNEVKHGAPKTFISSNLFRPERGLWFLSGYVISREGAEKLLSFLPCRGPVDLWINHKFKSLDVLATRKSIIHQRRDFSSTNSYSILPTLTKIGAINCESASLFQNRPNEKPVFVFGTKNSGLSSLAMALLLLGYRCCSDLQTLPDKELKMLLAGSNNRVFDAYVNIGVLENNVPILCKRYPKAKFILTKSESRIIDDKYLKIMHDLNDFDKTIINLDSFDKWQVVCEHLRCAPPVCSFPEITDLGQRELTTNTIDYNSIRKCNIPKRDKSPWIIESNSSWKGIYTITKIGKLEIEKIRFNINDNNNIIDTEQWLLRDDTFTDNLALFRPSNIELNPELGAVITIKKESLGVRDYSAAALTTHNQFLYGRFEAIIKASKVPGVVTGIFLHRDSPRQEIDIEIVGNRTNRLLVNVFYNPGVEGTKFDYGYRGAASFVNLGFDASESYHRFAIEWESNEIRWFVDNRLVHRRIEWNPTPIPHLPMDFHINIWPTRSIKLAGRLVNHKLPANTYIKAIELNAKSVYNNN